MGDIGKILEENYVQQEDFETFLVNHLHTERIDYDEKYVKYFCIDVCSFYENLKTNKSQIKKIIRKHSKRIKIENQELILKHIMRNISPNAKKQDRSMDEALKTELMSLPKTPQLRHKLYELFQPVKFMDKKKIKDYFLNHINTKYIYTTDNINPSCEHIVPKIIFSNNPDIENDMHNLFITSRYINNYRSSSKFKPINGECIYINSKKVTNKSRLANKIYKNTFEPEDLSKGRVARACAYFFTVYPQYIHLINRVIDIDIMIDWCSSYKPTNDELIKNYCIYKVQKNINPYVICPELINVFSCLTNKGISKEQSLEETIKRSYEIIKKHLKIINKCTTDLLKFE